MHCYLTKDQRESYLREIYYSSFSDRRVSVAIRNEDCKSLGKYLKKLYVLVEIGKGLSGEAETVLKEIVRFRMRGRPGFYQTKLMADFKRFLLFRGQRDEIHKSIQEQKCFHCIQEDSRPLPVLRADDDWYWGTKQQLRCGEIVADTLGGMDPVFGVLLFPAGGKLQYTNPNKRKILSRVIGKNNREEMEALMYHTAVHDACGYLLEYHGIGPGYNYLGTILTVFPTSIPQSGRIAALMFWKKLITEPEVPDEY